MFITPREIIDIVIMTFAIGYIFSNFIKREPEEGYDPLEHYQKNQLWESIKLGIIIAAPAVVLHELAHKFAAMSFGASAVLMAPPLFGIPYGWYILIILMQFFKMPLFFFVGGMVSHTALPALQSSIVSLAGPMTNLVLYGILIFLVKSKIINRKYHRIAMMSAKLNLFLFIFNMIPIPGFDGYNFLMNLINIF